jgi:hypothetical protein
MTRTLNLIATGLVMALTAGLFVILAIAAASSSPAFGPKPTVAGVGCCSERPIVDPIKKMK